jgi:uncharacterized membrane protein
MRFPSEATLQRVATFVAAFGIAVAVYITIADAGGGAPTCLAGGGGCETVANSSYSHLAGINVAVFGIAGYAMLLIASVLRSDAARFAGFGLALVGFGFSVYLTYIELFKIEAICQWCVASAVLMTILLVLGAARVIGYVGSESSGGEAEMAQ